MRLGDKHRTTRHVVISDFSGGLNTAAAQEMLKENELWRCENMDVDHNSGLLRVVDGNERVLSAPEGTTYRALLYDRVNDGYLAVDAKGAVYRPSLTSEKPELGASIGMLTGKEFPVSAPWEDGLLIASGGQLQYFNGKELKTLAHAPKASTTVFVRAGRVLTNDRSAGNESNVYYSSVGDEETWEDKSPDDSSAKWLEVGYKDGGRVLAFVPLAEDVLVVKDNRCVYRIIGNYPDWSVAEVSRNVPCASALSVYAAGTSALILGDGRLQELGINQYYGDIRAQDVGERVRDRLAAVDGENVRIISVPLYRQLWFPLKERWVLVYDLALGSFYQRRFARENLVDAVCVGEALYIVRSSSICRVKRHLGYDDGVKQLWRFATRRAIAHDDFFLKRGAVNITPHFDTLVEGNVKIGGLVLPLPTPYVAFRVWHNYSRVYHNRRRVCGANERVFNLYEAGDEVYENFEPVWHNYQPVYNPAALALGARCVYRNRTLAVSGMGAGCCFLLNRLDVDVAEV